MILFVGSEDVGYMVKQVTGEDVVYTGTIEHVDQIEERIFEAPYSVVIIDIAQFADFPDKISDEIYKLWSAYGRSFIFWAKGFSPQSELVSRLIRDGFGFFVMSAFPGQQKDELIRCLRFEATVNPPEPQITEELNKKDLPKNQKKVITIAVAGSCHRIGATTQAIQVCKYLQLKGHKPCYIAIDEPDIKMWDEIYEHETAPDDAMLHRVTIFNLDMYTDANRIVEIREMDYDYLVYDVGCIADDNFNTNTFLDKDIRIIVGGIAPKEMASMQRAYDNVLSKDTYYIFSFVSEDQQSDVLDMQGYLFEKTGFSGYTPDPFVYSGKSNQLYDKIIAAKEVKNKTKKSGLFGRKRK